MLILKIMMIDLSQQVKSFYPCIEIKRLALKIKSMTMQLSVSLYRQGTLSYEQIRT